MATVPSTSAMPVSDRGHVAAQYVVEGQKGRLMHRNKKTPYSITSSAMASSTAGTSRPSALAFFRLMTNSNSRTTGKSLALSPLRMQLNL